MPEMTDEEADYWDEYFTANPPKLGANGTDFLSLREIRKMGLDNMSETWLRGKAETTHRSIGEVINELVRKEIAAAV